MSPWTRIVILIPIFKIRLYITIQFELFAVSVNEPVLRASQCGSCSSNTRWNLPFKEWHTAHRGGPGFGNSLQLKLLQRSVFPSRYASLQRCSCCSRELLQRIRQKFRSSRAPVNNAKETIYHVIIDLNDPHFPYVINGNMWIRTSEFLQLHTNLFEVGQFEVIDEKWIVSRSRKLLILNRL